MKQSVTTNGGIRGKWLKNIGGIIYVLFTIVAFILGSSVANNDMLQYILGDIGNFAPIVTFVIIDLIGGFFGAIPYGIGELICQAEIQNGYLQIIAKVPDIRKYTVEYTIDIEDDNDGE
jgi:hypothetical protein